MKTKGRMIDEKPGNSQALLIPKDLEFERAHKFTPGV
jgi:hypothetical protein